MAHYAILDEDNIVIEVIVGVDETEDAPEGHDDWESFYSSLKGDKTVKRTSYNTLLGEHSDGKTPFRGNYAGIGYHYLPDDDIFLVPPQYDYFVADVDNFVYIPPIEKPDDGKNYVWDDDDYQSDNTEGWVLIEEPEE